MQECLLHFLSCAELLRELDIVTLRCLVMPKLVFSPALLDACECILQPQGNLTYKAQGP